MIGIHLKKFASMLRKLGLKRKMILGTGTLFVGICLVCVMLMQKRNTENQCPVHHGVYKSVGSEA